MNIPAYNVRIPITPSATANFRIDAKPCEAIFVGGAGDIALVMSNGTAQTLVGCVGGAVYPIAAIRVNVTGTTATSLEAWYTN